MGERSFKVIARCSVVALLVVAGCPAPPRPGACESQVTTDGGVVPGFTPSRIRVTRTDLAGLSSWWFELDDGVGLDWETGTHLGFLAAIPADDPQLAGTYRLDENVNGNRVRGLLMGGDAEAQVLNGSISFEAVDDAWTSNFAVTTSEGRSMTGSFSVSEDAGCANAAASDAQTEVGEASAVSARKVVQLSEQLQLEGVARLFRGEQPALELALGVDSQQANLNGPCTVRSLVARFAIENPAATADGGESDAGTLVRTLVPTEFVAIACDANRPTLSARDFEFGFVQSNDTIGTVVFLRLKSNEPGVEWVVEGTVTFPL